MAAEQPLARSEFPDSRFEAVRPEVGRRLGVALAALVLVLVVMRLWLVRKIATPWIMSDELLYSELARSFADGGHFLVREGFYPVYNVGYPVLVSPAWLAGSMETTYGLAKAINVALMTTALLPLYFWARRLVSPGYAAVATGLAALMPSFLYTGMIMTENAFFPAFVATTFAFALMLERPSLPRQGLALAAIGVSYFARAQGLVLALVLPVAVLLKLALDARTLPAAGRWRSVVGEARRYAPIAAVYVVGGVGYVLYQAVRGVPLNSVLGAYSGLTVVDYSLSDAARWTLEHFAELGLSVGLFPLSALVVLLGLALLRGAESQAERAFLAVTGAAVLVVVVQVAVYASWFSLRVEERYMFFLAPLLLVALVLWLQRGLPRPPLLTGVAALGPAALLVALPLRERLNISILSDTFTFIPLLRLSNILSGGVPTVRTLMLAGGFAAAAVFALLPRRIARPALPAAVAAFFVLVTYAVFGSIRDHSSATRDLIHSPRQDWVDAALPPGSSAGFLFGASADPFVEAHLMWQVEFWNRDVMKVYNLAPEPASFAKTAAGVDRLTGRIAPQDGRVFPFRYVVTSDNLGLSGRLIARQSPFALYQVRPPLRLVSEVEGLYADGWMGAEAALTRYVGRPRRLEVRLSRQAWQGPDVPGRVTIELGKPAAEAGGAVGLGRVLERRTWVIHSGAHRTFRLRAPKPPFRVEIHVSPTFSPIRFGKADPRELGAQVDLSIVR
ncbi:MAG TPA: hypothetical protein VGQ68_00980 [Gaiellaceae bacterium]|nr:hypothetical protein [Gaiellaceae bacterium]